MREYGLVFSQFWISSTIQSLSVDGKLLALYLLTCSHANMLGCFRLPPGYIAEDLQWPSERVREGFKELTRIRFVVRDEATGWLVIPQFLKWNPIENPNQGKSIIKLFHHVPPQSTVYQTLIRALMLITHGKHLDEPFLNRLQTLVQPLLNQEQDQDQEPEQEQDQEQESSAVLAAAPVVRQPLDTLPIVPKTVITIPLNDHSEFAITSTQLAEWQELYPTIDVLQTLRHIRGWNLANAQKRKTKKGILKHITQWLAKEQDRYASRRAPPARDNANLYAYNQAVGTAWLQETTDHSNPKEPTRP